MGDKMKLVLHLRECGLHNTELWLSELGKLGVQSKASLVDHEGNMSLFSQLEEKAEFPEEKGALRRLLKVESFCKSNNTEQQNYFIRQKEIVDFEGFDKFLKEILQKARISNCNGDTNSPLTYESQVSKGIRQLRSHYYQTYDDILIYILMLHFQSNNPSNIQDLESLRVLFSEQRKKFIEYMKKHPWQRQAFLFDLAVGLNHSIEKANMKQLLEQIKNMMRFVQPPLEQELLKHLNAYRLGASSIMAFQQSMQYLMTTPVPARRQQISCSGNPKNVLQTEMRICEIASQPEDHSPYFKNNPHAHILFEKLGLIKYYPKGIQLQDALCIRPEALNISLQKTNPTDTKQLPYLILHKLMSYDCLCRSDLMPIINREDASKTECDDSATGIHPVDGILALILCSDDFLRQDLFSRLAKCQLAVPFLLPDPFTKQLILPLWAMRSIIKDWKCTTENNTIKQKTNPVVSYAMPIVSFIRFGERQKRGASKSKLLNMVINDSHYDHFFHRDCPGGKYNLLLGEGLVDMCWYLPAGEPGDAFSDAVTFLNLHGDARQYPQHCRFLSQISSMCFILLTEEVLELDSQTVEILKQFTSSPGGVTLLNDVDKKPRAMRKQIPKARVINLTTKNGSEIKNTIQHQIRAKLGQVIDFQSIEDWCGNREETIFIDEDSDSYKEGLVHADKIMSMITNYKGASSIKEAMLPLQGAVLWRTWASLDKELHRQFQRGKKTVNDYTADIEHEKKAIRKKQLEHIESLTPMMESFIVSLLKLGGSSNRIVRNYFLQCLKLQLNNLSRDSISDLQYKYQSARYKLAECDSLEGKARVRRELEMLQESIINFPFGLEHLLRELGQVYEAALESLGILSHLPNAAAELLIDGYPLELMDGEAAHVPIQWVTAVLKKAAEMLGDPKVFVLSVLGLQSTGKSTMLNTAFGLQFNVDAAPGRCTRGAFMQLIPVDKELNSQTKGCRYVLVVDTACS